LERPAGSCAGGWLLATILLGAFLDAYDPIAIDLAHPFTPPSAAHWLGSDQFAAMS